MNASTAGIPHTVIRASAGTGKTFQLSNRFIGLAVRQPLDTILATTFTRKAAGEILDRVLVRLAEAAMKPQKLAELSRHVPGCSLDRGQCLGLLRDMIRHLHRLRVSTLDSFFVELAQSFGLELGFPPGWKIVDEIEDAAIRAEAIRTVLANTSTQDVVRLMHLLTKGEATRSVSEQIATLVEALYAIYAEAPPEAWKSLPRKTMMTGPEFTAALEAIEHVAVPAGVRYQDTRKRNLDNARRGNWEKFLDSGLGTKILDGSELFYSKPIPPDVLEVYRPVVEYAKAFLLNRTANQTEATYELLERFDTAYQRLKSSERSLRFEDITRRLSEAALGERLEEIVYRLDGHVAHLLLDEFQDTSALQWRVLRPFVQRVVRGADRSLFCVGDVKQAIYGWRGGVAEIFDAVDEEFGPLPVQALNESFRSSPVVIDCVNRVFENISSNAVLQKCPAAVQNWSKRFATHSTARGDLPGYCRLVTAVMPVADETQETATLRYAAEEAARLHEQLPNLDIGILVRRNKAVARLIFELRELGIEASEEGGNPLIDSPAVQVILSLLTLADHPGDMVARFHVATSPLAAHVGLVDHGDWPAAWRLAEEIRRRLMVESYGPLVEGWTRQLAAVCDRRDVSRLGQLVEIAYGYEERATNRPSDFVHLVTEQKVEDPTSARVRVMSIHQSKGLQFDIVVLPELDVRMTGQPPEIVAGCPKPAARIDRVCRHLSNGKSKKLRTILPDDFQQMFAAHEERVIEESLCLLYVAMTRAVHSLHMVIAPSKANERTVPYTFAGVLRTALDSRADNDNGSLVYQHGDPLWFEKLTVKAETPPVAPPAATAKPRCWPQRPTQPTRGLEHRSPSRLEGGGVVMLGQRFRLDRGTALDRGTLFHAWFERVKWLEEGEPTDAELRQAAVGAIVDPTDLPALIAEFRAARRETGRFGGLAEGDLPAAGWFQGALPSVRNGEREKSAVGSIPRTDVRRRGRRWDLERPGRPPRGALRQRSRRSGRCAGLQDRRCARQ